MTTTTSLEKMERTHGQVYDHAFTQSARSASITDSISGGDTARSGTQARGRGRPGRPKLDEANPALQRHARSASQHAVHVRRVFPVSYGR
jgi:hypothetical protein